ncbi:MAG: homoserine O-succinyltransferase, partial [Gemmatimonadetes bacterium]|nr:homoserine O-succinyltransferase [Gemmatimonadota bacterium]
MIWEAHGPAHAPAVVVLGGISAGSHLLPTGADPTPGWWPGIVGRSRALDPDRVRLVGVDFLDLAPSPD